ncbi:MAG TPA: LysR substrate-binding domain-containing protein [Gemmatimonadales bacterium]|nr:LysR substrate-binding domain-containing protein [Gemmatimonadales bacterium]
MDLRQLRYFVAVAEELHFTRAATRLRVTQPTLSQQVRLLEKELGVRLLKRNRRNVELTHPGRIFLGEAKRLLASAEEAIKAARSAQDGRLGKLVVVCGPTAAYAGLLGLLESYRRRSPKVEVQIVESPVIDAVVTVEHGQADVGLVVPYFESSLLKREVVLELPLLAALPKSHPLANAKTVSLEQLAGDPFILFGQRRGSGFFERVLGICNACGFTPRVLEAMEHIHTLLYMVGAGYGVSLVPTTLAPVERPEVALVPLHERAATLEIGMIWRFDQDSPLVTGFLETVRSWCKDLPIASR